MSVVVVIDVVVAVFVVVVVGVGACEGSFEGVADFSHVSGHVGHVVVHKCN